jgi:hypothetical protein
MKIPHAKFPAFKITLLMAWLFLAAGCAKIADPLPPVVRIPKPAEDLAAAQLADSVVLTFSNPTLNTDGSPATTLNRIQVLRLDEDARVKKQSVSEKTFIQRAEPILTIESADFPGYLQNGIFVVRDQSAIPKKSKSHLSAFRYAVLLINKKKQTAGLSNQVRLTPVSLPSHPDGFSAEVTEDSIRLRWEAPTENTDGTKPARIAGYNIYKSLEPEKMPEAPINPEPVQSLGYEDRNFQFDKTYYYAISTVGSLKDPYAESLPSKIHSVITRDIFPPAPPENFNAAREGNDIILLWAPSSSEDVAGYRIFRRDNQAKTPQLLQKELITALSFRDQNTLSGRSYEYTIYAVDTHGNESKAVQADSGIK